MIIYFMLLILAVAARPTCKFNEIRYKSSNNIFICEACLICPPGEGLSQECGSTIPHNINLSCNKCKNDEYSSHNDTSMCRRCQLCEDDEIEIQPCSARQNRVCSCQNGLDRSVSSECSLECCYCSEGMEKKDECSHLPGGKNCAPGKSQTCPTTVKTFAHSTSESLAHSTSESLAHSTSESLVTTSKTKLTISNHSKPLSTEPISKLIIVLICLAIVAILLAVVGIVLMLYKKPCRKCCFTSETSAATPAPIEEMLLVPAYPSLDKLLEETACPCISGCTKTFEANQDYFKLDGSLRVNIDNTFNVVKDKVIKNTLMQFATVLELGSHKFKDFSSFTWALNTKYPTFGCHVLVRLLRLANRNDVIQLLHDKFHQSPT